jgi:hypothetical protein
MRRFRIAQLVVSALLVAGCGAGESKLEVKAGGKSLPFAVKSSGTYSAVKTFTENKDGQTKITKASSNYIVLANYDLDTSSGMSSMEKATTAADQVRVAIQIVGQEGTDDKTGFKTGTYQVKSEKFDKVDYVNVAFFADGKETKNFFDLSKASGQVKITAVAADSVSGEIDLTEGDKTVKGTFTARFPVKK